MNEDPFTSQCAVVRIYHSALIEGCLPKDAKDAQIDLTMFKSLKITGDMTSSSLITVLAQKLAIKDKSMFGLYSLDSNFNSIKQKIDDEESPMELVVNDVSKKLKLAVLHRDEANILKGAAQVANVEYYSLSGSTVVGPYPKPKEHILPHADELLHHRKLLNPEYIPYLNLTLIVEGKERIYSMRSIVEQRCPALLLAVKYIKKTKEKKGNLLGPMKIEYKENTIVNSFVITQILDWCYTSTLDFLSLTIPDVMVILKAAQELGIPHLQFICEQYIRSELTIDSSFIILKQAQMLEMQDIKELATQYAHSKWAQFTQHRGGMDIIGLELFQELTVAMSQANGRRQSIDGLATVKDTLISDFETIYKEARFVDAEFVVTPPLRDDGTRADVTTFKFHKAIVAAYSKPLFNLISMQPKAKQFTIDGLYGAAISGLLSFIYFGKSDLDPVGACQIVEHAMSQYSLHAIREAASFSIAHGIDTHNAVSILRMTYLPQCKHRSMVKLREVALLFICEHFNSINIPALRNLEHSEFGHNLLADVLECYFYYRHPDKRRDSSDASAASVFSPSLAIPIPRRSAGGKKSARV